MKKKLKVLDELDIGFCVYQNVDTLKKFSHIISRKLIISAIGYLDPSKKYPKLKTIIYDERVDMSGFNSQNFPNLENINITCLTGINKLDSVFKTTPKIFHNSLHIGKTYIAKYNLKYEYNPFLYMKGPIYKIIVGHDSFEKKFITEHFGKMFNYLLKKSEKYRMTYVHNHVLNMDKDLLAEIFRKCNIVLAFIFSDETRIEDLFLFLSELRFVEPKIIPLTYHEYEDYDRLVELYKKTNIFIKIRRRVILHSCPEYAEIRRHLYPLWKKSKI